ncbi:hypothetical protein COS91_08090 [Candidatus Desantisbacteria bacterium CG07_land_8_20_14_0_80_39_15]|uniref:Peptidase S9 prolyl oligopeptidase catalytic domain-containing protein n=1 Tax=Candidatus Desantisbacteria bacterium CG07_land_8_20_14_0_80_39_15 TaxID=1974549 RepID=A0A2M6ZEF8_9BACT|nr:MAG: hypothetical protein COS91_08090 [Candidatus Desantisbacteria bacterium CG07_land_8_20_14_0_80_39_15]
MHPPRDPMFENPSNLGMSYQKIFLETPDRVILSGWFIPKPGSNATVIFCHGYGTNKADCLPFVPFLHSAGYNLFLFDFRAHGESGGECCSLGGQERQDLFTAIRWVQSRKGLNPNCIGVLGISMGAATAIMVAAETTALKVVIADSSFSKLSDILGYQLRDYYLPSFPFAWVSSTWMGIKSGFNPFKYSPENSISRIAPRPVLLIHGRDDDQIPARHSLILYKKSRGHCELWVVSDAVHLGSFFCQPQKYQEKILKLFDKYIK